MDDVNTCYYLNDNEIWMSMRTWILIFSNSWRRHRQQQWAHTGARSHLCEIDFSIFVFLLLTDILYSNIFLCLDPTQIWNSGRERENLSYHFLIITNINLPLPYPMLSLLFSLSRTHIFLAYFWLFPSHKYLLLPPKHTIPLPTKCSFHCTSPCYYYFRQRKDFQRTKSFLSCDWKISQVTDFYRLSYHPIYPISIWYSFKSLRIFIRCRWRERENMSNSHTMPMNWTSLWTSFILGETFLFMEIRRFSMSLVAREIYFGTFTRN